MIELFNLISSAWQGLPDWLKTVLRRTAISTAALSAVSQLAVYWYAIRYGARLPLEGVAFLILVSVVASIVVSLVSISTLIGVARSEKMKGRKVVEKKEIFGIFTYRVHELSRNEKWLAAISASIAGASAAFLIFTPFSLANNGTPIPVAGMAVALIVLLISLSVLLGFSADKASFQQKTGTVIYIGGVAFISLALMGTFFDQILRFARYGGGIEASFKLEDGTAIDSTRLFLTSTETITVWHPDQAKFEQLYVPHIVSMRFSQSPEFMLPPSRSAWQIFFDSPDTYVDPYEWERRQVEQHREEFKRDFEALERRYSKELDAYRIDHEIEEASSETLRDRELD